MFFVLKFMKYRTVASFIWKAVLVRQTYKYLDVIWLLSKESTIILWAGCDELISIKSEKCLFIWKHVSYYSWILHYFSNRDEDHDNGQDWDTEISICLYTYSYFFFLMACSTIIEDFDILFLSPYKILALEKFEIKNYLFNRWL